MEISLWHCRGSKEQTRSCPYGMFAHGEHGRYP